MNRIEKKFEELKDRGEGALISFITAGDPRPEMTKDFIKALIDGGTDIIELGVPFSDPIADGPTIQAASERALKAGTNPDKVFEIVKDVRNDYDVPIVFLTYYNLLFKPGLENFVSKASKAGVDGILAADLSIEECVNFKNACDKNKIDTIFLAAPSTSVPRLNQIVEKTSGFLYLVALFGVTGARENVQELTIETVQKFKPHTENKIPLCVGFGISKPEHVKTLINAGADGIIVGSAFIKEIEKNLGDKKKIIKILEEKAKMLNQGR